MEIITQNLMPAHVPLLKRWKTPINQLFATFQLEKYSGIKKGKW
jgi:hypothetical protein